MVLGFPAKVKTKTGTKELITNKIKGMTITVVVVSGGYNHTGWNFGNYGHEQGHKV